MEPIDPNSTVAVVPGMWQRLTAHGRVARWSRLVGAFLGGQVVFQGLTMVTGFLLLHWLSRGGDVVPYAQYALAISVQATLAGVVELGFPAAVAALVGARKDDAALVGAYVRAAQSLRDALLWIAAPVAVAVLVALGLHQGWGISALASMALCVATMAYLQGQTVFTAMVLHMHRDMRGAFAGQIRWAVVRLALLAALMAAGAINVHWALWTSAGASLLVCAEMRRRSLGLMRVPTAADPVRRAELLSFMAPLVPTHVFSVLQPQIVVLLASVFGASATIAEVGALGRIAALFIIVHMFHAIIVSHHFARMHVGRVARNYLFAVGGSAAYLSLVALAGFRFPAAFLWILGSSYAHLGAEVGWIVLASCLLCLQHLLWTIHFARRWVYWWFTAANIGLCLATQIACLALVDVSTTHGAVMFSVWSSAALLGAQVVLAASQAFRRDAAHYARE